MKAKRSGVPHGAICAGLIVFAQIFGSSALAALRPTVIDNSFKPDLPGWDLWSIRTVVQPDGKVLVGGLSNGVPRVTRLEQNGSKDGSFQFDLRLIPTNAGPQTGNSLDGLALQPDGKILLAEALPTTNEFVGRLVRLNPDGSQDDGFHSGIPTGQGGRYSVQVLRDGRIFVASDPGGEGTANGRSYLYNYAHLLGTNGSLQRIMERPTFQNPNNRQTFVASATVQSDGELLVAGQFSAPGTNLVRVNPDWSVDKSFKPQLNAADGDFVSAIALQSDGKILVASVLAVSAQDPFEGGTVHLVRLLPDGQLDSKFASARELPRMGSVSSISVLADDRFLVSVASSTSRSQSPGYSLLLERDGRLALDLSAVAASLNGSVTGAVLDYADRVLGLLSLMPGPNSTAPWYGPPSFGRFFTQGTTIPGVEFAQARYTVNEAESAAVITLRRSGDISQPMSARLTTQDGTAKAGVDYLARSEVVQLSAGEEMHSFPILILDDPIVEGNETVLLALSEASPGAVVSGRDSAVLTIADNERPTLIDPKFNAANGGQTPLLVQPDGKIVSLGHLPSSPDGTTDLIRLNADGTRDQSFVSPLGQNLWIRTAAIQPDGKLLLGGTFTNIHNASRSSLVRFNSDGTLDADFNPIFAFATTNRPPAYELGVTSIRVQADGKIVVGGSFASVSGSSHDSIVRLNPDGTVDSSFQAHVQFQEAPRLPGFVGTMLLQEDGKILIDPWPRPALINGKLRNSRPIRLNPDGTLDESFVPANNFGDQIALDLNSSILSWTSDCVRRFNRDGSEDSSFQFACGQGQSIGSLMPAADGGVLAVVSDRDGAQRLSRLGADGAIANEYPLGPENSLSILGEVNGALLVSGSFNGAESPVARLLPLGNNSRAVQFSAPALHVGEDSGSATVAVVRTGDTASALKVDYVTAGDPGYAGTSGTINFAPLETTRTLRLPILDNPLVNPNQEIKVVLTNATDGVLLGAGLAAQTIVIHDDERPGSLDFTFTRSTGVESYGNRFEALALQPDGKVLAAGVFASHDGERYTTLDRLNQDGSRDESFEVEIEPDLSWGASASITYIVPRPNGKIVVGGKHPVARLEASGALDQTFDAGALATKVNALAVQNDEKILVAGVPPSDGQPAQPVLVRLQPNGQLDASFAIPRTITQVTALTVQLDGKILAVASVGASLGLLRLENSGAIDPAFLPASVAANGVTLMAMQSDGKILVWALTADSTEKLVRLNPDGSLDPSFVDKAGGGNATAIVVQSDGRILLAGGDVRRLNADGSIDASFDTGSVPQGSVNHLMLQPDGRVIIAGTFAEFDGAPRSGIARLHGDPELRFTAVSQRSAGPLEMTCITLPGRQYILQMSSDLSSWRGIRTNIAAAYSLVFEDLPVAGTNRFYRVFRGIP